MRSERSSAAREACIARHKGDLSCVVCGFNFEKVYDERGSGFIHVHHLKPIAKGKRKVDPAEDLCPVCPNCHYMLHRGNLISPEDLRKLLRKQ